MNRSERRAQWRQQHRAQLNDARPASRVVSLHINELVLHGFPLKIRHAVGDATQSELSRLLTSTGLPEFVQARSNSDAIDGGSFNLTPATRPHAVGSLIANAVYGG